MKKEILEKLQEFRGRLHSLKGDISAITSNRVTKKELRDRADEIATIWVEELRSPLEHKFKFGEHIIRETADQMKHLHILSRPNNLKSSYIKVLSATLRNFDNKFILPIKQTSTQVDNIFDLIKLVPNLPDPAESEYLKEAIDCASSGYYRASIVMGWCAAIDRIQKKILELGFQQFNAASLKLKNQKRGKFKNWNKEFSISTLSELQTVFDNDLIVVLEGMGLLDGNQAARLQICFQYRNHSGHPGEAPIEEPHVVTFFSDINSIILQNPRFELKKPKPTKEARI